MIEIRAFGPTDAPACRDLWVSLTDHHRDIYDAPGIGGEDPGAGWDEHLARVGPSNLWVAVAEDDVVGLTGLIDDGEQAELEPLVVAPGHRGSGIGRRLVARVLEEARARGRTRVHVRPVARNAAALAAFRSYGFTTVGHVELFVDLDGRERDWRPGAELGGLTFDV